MAKQVVFELIFKSLLFALKSLQAINSSSLRFTYACFRQ